MGDVAINLTNSSKQFRWTASKLLKSLKASVPSRRLKGRREAHNAEVVERALFATRKSLKSLAAKKSFPIQQHRAVTSKLCSHSRPTAIENHPAAKLCPALNSRWRAPHLHVPPAISSIERFRTPAAGVRGIARAQPASENVHKSPRHHRHSPFLISPRRRLNLRPCAL